ncbi:MAG: hypothetical protein ACE5HC_02625 [Candidatus Binatia bacterium]
MTKFLSVIIGAAGLLVLTGAGPAHWEGGPGSGTMREMNHGFMGSKAHGCPGFEATTTPITTAKAEQLARQYADRNLKGYTVGQVLPFAGMHHTMYSVELKNEAGELRTLHINPFGKLMPLAGPWQHGS